MKKIVQIILLAVLLSCSEDPYDFTLDEIYKDYYKQQIVDEKLSLRERSLIDLAEQRYEQQGKLNELRNKTLIEIIKEQENLSNINKVSKKIKIEIIDKVLLKTENGTFLQWKLKLLNNVDVDIKKIQGWLEFTDSKTKEILRVDTLNCNMLLKSKSYINFSTQPHDYNPNIKANSKLMKSNIEDLNKILNFKPTLIEFSDGTELTNTTG